MNNQLAVVPDDFLSHRASWRKAIELAIANAKHEDDRSYWRHELRAYDRAYAELDAS